MLSLKDMSAIQEPDIIIIMMAALALSSVFYASVFYINAPVFIYEAVAKVF